MMKRDWRFALRLIRGYAIGGAFLSVIFLTVGAPAATILSLYAGALSAVVGIALLLLWLFP
jgi:hypothetical protein